MDSDGISAAMRVAGDHAEPSLLKNVPIPPAADKPVPPRAIPSVPLVMLDAGKLNVPAVNVPVTFKLPPKAPLPPIFRLAPGWSVPLVVIYVLDSDGISAAMRVAGDQAEPSLLKNVPIPPAADKPVPPRAIPSVPLVILDAAMLPVKVPATLRFPPIVPFPPTLKLNPACGVIPF